MLYQVDELECVSKCALPTLQPLIVALRPKINFGLVIWELKVTRAGAPNSGRYAKESAT